MVTPIEWKESFLKKKRLRYIISIKGKQSILLLMSSLVKPHNWSFLRKQESRKIKEKTGFPLKNCGNDGNISNVLLLMNSLVTATVRHGKDFREENKDENRI